jgi:hypothetical protein
MRPAPYNEDCASERILDRDTGSQQFVARCISVELPSGSRGNLHDSQTKIVASLQRVAVKP